MKPTFLRSALGFMSAATRWGDYLFPGITVLTRDLHDVVALHQVYCERLARRDHPPLRLLSGQRWDFAVGQELGRVLKRYKIPRPARLTQQMTYWQRYGSFFRYFQLIKRRKTGTVDSYRRMVFSRDTGSVAEDPQRRRRRIRHFEWYRTHRRHLLANLAEPGTDLNGRRWWLTGLGAPSRTPIGIVLARRLEYCFIIWQTAFESAAWLLHRERVLPTFSRLSAGDPETLVTALLAARSNPTTGSVTRLLRAALSSHESTIRGTMTAWERRVRHELDADGDVDALTALHNGESIASLGDIPARELLEPLAQLHVLYAGLQNKPQAVAVLSFKDLKPGPRLPSLNVEFTSQRWGLHGYRLEAAQTLHESEKYRI